MWVLAILAYSMVSIYSSANNISSTYRVDSIVPLDLQKLVLKEIQSKCPNGISPYGISEIQSEIISSSESCKQKIESQFLTRYTKDGERSSGLIKVVSSKDFCSRELPAPVRVESFESDSCE
jgi:hypothetical protein